MRRLLALIAIGSITVIALALAAYVELAKFRPEEEWARMRAALLRLHTVRFDAGMHWTAQGGVTTVYAQGQAQRDRGEVDHVTRFRAVSTDDATSHADLSGEIRQLRGVSYLTYAPPGPTISAVSFDAPGTWVAIAPSSRSRWGPLLPGATPVFSEGPVRSPWDASGILRLIPVLSRADVLRFSQDAPKERLVRGTDTRVIDARVDREAAFAFLLEVARAREGREPADGQRLQASREADVLEGAYVRLWIGKDDHLPRRVNVVGWLPGEEREVLDMRLDLSGFDEPFEGEVPSPNVAFQPALEAAQAARSATSDGVGTTFASLPALRFPASEDRDLDGLDDVLEAFYGTDPALPDTDGDGKDDGEEVREGRNPRGTGSLFGFGLD